MLTSLTHGTPPSPEGRRRPEFMMSDSPNKPFIPWDRGIGSAKHGGSERTSIERLSQFYIYDFPEMEPPGRNETEFK